MFPLQTYDKKIPLESYFIKNIKKIRKKFAHIDKTHFVAFG